MTKVSPRFWSPASQEFSHVGNAGVGVISLRGCTFDLAPPLPPLGLVSFFWFG